VEEEMRVFAFSLIGLIACSTPTGSQTLEQQEKRSASDKVLNAIDKLLTLTEQMGDAINPQRLSRQMPIP
jgi:hypothetical protein